ncbi:MAG: hypothetical protein JW986_09590 [Methanotrichaceae archaeon]|nr:hypothetical protein [Methanotrichaceae archaeon]
MSNDGDVSGNHGGTDYWVVKLGPTKAIEWQKCLGGSSDEYGNSLQQTLGGYILSGSTGSNDGDVSGNHGGADYWIVKLDQTGALEWQKCLGGSGDDYAYSIQQTSDGGYIVCGETSSNDGDIIGNHGGADYWIVKLNQTGFLEWQKCLGGSGEDYAYSIQQTSDGGYIVAGDTSSNDGDVSGNHGGSDYWVVKLDQTGALKWQKCLGGSYDDYAFCIQQTSNNGYIIAGDTSSNDGDVSGNHGFSDCWIVRLGPSEGGPLEWQKCLGGSFIDLAHSIRQTGDGGFIVSGSTVSEDGDVIGKHLGSDCWVFKLGSSGTLEWQRCLGGSEGDNGYDIQEMGNGYILAGITSSDDGDVGGNHGPSDSWIVRLTRNPRCVAEIIDCYITPSSPSMIQDAEGRIHVFVRGSDDSLCDYVDGTWQILGGRITSDPYAVKDDLGRIHVFVMGLDGSLWDRMLDGGWVSLGGFSNFDPSAALSPEDGHLKIAVIGLDNSVWINDFDCDTLTGSWYSLGGWTTSNPQVIFDQLGVMHVFVQGSDGALYENADGSWIGHGGIITSDAIPIFYPLGQAICTFVRGSDGSLWEYMDGTGWTGLGGTILEPTPSFDANPAVVADSNCNLWAFVCGSDSHLWLNLLGEWQSMGGSIISSDPSAIFDETTGMIHVAGRAEGGQLCIWHVTGDQPVD